MPPRERVLYCETYRKGAAVISKEYLPITRHTKVFQPVEMHILKAGVIQRGAEELEFQDVRLFFPRAKTGG